MNKNRNRTYMGIVVVASLCALLPARAGISFGIGVNSQGTALSVDYRNNDRRGSHGHLGRDYYRQQGCLPLRPPAVVYRQPQGRYMDQIERYWVDGYWSRRVSRHGYVTQLWVPGYWAERIVRVWVNY